MTGWSMPKAAYESEDAKIHASPWQCAGHYGYNYIARKMGDDWTFISEDDTFEHARSAVTWSTRYG